MARRLARLSPEARAWFLAEIAYIAMRNPAAAEKIVARLRAARETLSDYPKLGQLGLIPATRRFVMAPYVLTIRLIASEVEIISMRHARQGDAYEPDDDTHI